MKPIMVLICDSYEDYGELFDSFSKTLNVQILPCSTSNNTTHSHKCISSVLIDDDISDDLCVWKCTEGSAVFAFLRSVLVNRDSSRVGLTSIDKNSFKYIQDEELDSLGEFVFVDIDGLTSKNIDKSFRKFPDVELKSNGTQTEDVFLGLSKLLTILGSKGGVLTGDQIKALVKLECLMKKADVSSCSTASYDLNLGDEAWCQGNYLTLDEKDPFLIIPRYSYAIVSAKECACLPTFIAGRFDLKVSFFFQGVILSNGPQVDPGYNGALFCMLYNGSDSPVAIRRGSHFATIEFKTTTTKTSGYSEHYQNKTALSEFIPGHAAAASGGAIVERIEKESNDLKNSWEVYKNYISLIVPSLVAISLGINFYAFTLLKSVDEVPQEESVAIRSQKELLLAHDLRMDHIKKEVEDLKIENKELTIEVERLKIKRILEGQVGEPINSSPERNRE